MGEKCWLSVALSGAEDRLRFTSYNCYIDRLGNLSGKVASGIDFYYAGKHDCGLSCFSVSLGVDTELFS